MATASDRGWSLNPATVLVPCAGIPLRVRPEVAPLFAELIRRVEQIKGKGWMTSSGGYNPRPVRGYELKYSSTGNQKYLSNHAWGLAADFRAGTNPMQVLLRTDMPSNIKQIAQECGLQWGGSYLLRKDPMHFEAVGTPAEIAASVRAIQERNSAPTVSDDEEWLNVDVDNPFSGKKEPAGVAIGYMEQRVSDRVTANITSYLKSDEFLNAVAARATKNLLDASLGEVDSWDPKSGSVVKATLSVFYGLRRAAEASIVRWRGETVPK